MYNESRNQLLASGELSTLSPTMALSCWMAPTPCHQWTKGKNKNNSLVILSVRKKRIFMAMLGDQIFGALRLSWTAWPYLESFWPHLTTLVQRSDFPTKPSKFC